MSYSIFATTVARYIRDEDMGVEEARQAAAEDLLAHSTYASILAEDPGYIAWAKRQDQLDRKYHEENS
jgi:hypothetical protein